MVITFFKVEIIPKALNGVEIQPGAELEYQQL
jgi:hypothetical protein